MSGGPRATRFAYPVSATALRLWICFGRSPGRSDQPGTGRQGDDSVTGTASAAGKPAEGGGEATGKGVKLGF